MRTYIRIETITYIRIALGLALYRLACAIKPLPREGTVTAMRRSGDAGAPAAPKSQGFGA